VPQKNVFDDEILEYAGASGGVPVTLAAKYIGMSANTLREALRQGRVGFGMAVKSESGKWVFNIQAKPLVEYRNRFHPMLGESVLIRIVRDTLADTLAETLNDFRNEEETRL
jgi:hypothetical protein